MKQIYFDNNATTPIDPLVKEAMLPFLEDRFGNPSSAHRFGEAAKDALDEAREQVAALLNCRPRRLFFTGGGTEANNIAIWSAIRSNPEKKHILSSQVEHASVLTPLRYLQKNHGYEISLLPVDTEGGLSLGQLETAIRPDTIMVSLMAANNETGVIWPIDKIAALCREHAVLFHTDAVQYAGKAPIAAEELGVDYLTVASHKMHGPKGVGALYAGRKAPLTPLVMGAGQERGVRAGTENMSGIAGFGKACELALAALDTYCSRTKALRDRLETTIKKEIEDILINGADQPRLANTSNISFRLCSSAAMIQELDEAWIAVSGHSACHSGDLDPSHVLSAMRVPEPYLHGALRISLSRMNDGDEVDALLAALPGIIAKLRKDFAV